MDHTGSHAELETILQQIADLSQEKHLIPELQLLRCAETAHVQR